MAREWGICWLGPRVKSAGLEIKSTIKGPVMQHTCLHAKQCTLQSYMAHFHILHISHACDKVSLHASYAACTDMDPMDRDFLGHMQVFLCCAA